MIDSWLGLWCQAMCVNMSTGVESWVSVNWVQHCANWSDIYPSCCTIWTHLRLVLYFSSLSIRSLARQVQEFLCANTLLVFLLWSFLKRCLHKIQDCLSGEKEKKSAICIIREKSVSRGIFVNMDSKEKNTFLFFLFFVCSRNKSENGHLLGCQLKCV